VARRQVRLVQKTDADKEALTKRLLMTGKTAAVGEMSAGLAHEINNPLATIDTLQTWIADLASSPAIGDEDRAEILESASKIGQQVQRCKVITQGLLKFSRKVDSRPQRIDLDELLSDLVAVTRARARLENVAIELDLGGLPQIWGTPAHLQQIFVNLVNNAIDATAGLPEAQVTVRSRSTERGVRVAVHDNGPGIAPEHLSNIFLPFFTTKPVGKGTGLGLAITYGLVHELGGSITVDSKPGRGADFVVELPVDPPVPPPRPSEARPSSRGVA
jgi:two-component system NtrC family sensor kinase